MLRKLSSFDEVRIRSVDQEIGSTAGYLFDNLGWAVRYFIVRGSGPLDGRDLLISPASFYLFDADRRTLRLNDTARKIEKAPAVGASTALTQADEAALAEYYGWPAWWEHIASPPGSYTETSGGVTAAVARRTAPVLREAKDMLGYGLVSRDGNAGALEDYIVDDVSWGLPFLVINTLAGTPQKRILISPRWLAKVDDHRRELHINVNQELIEDAPEYEPGSAISPSFKEQLCGYFGFPPNWC